MNKIASIGLIFCLFTSQGYALKDPAYIKRGDNIYKNRHIYANPSAMPQEELTCEDLLGMNLTYPTGEVATYCRMAEHACIQYTLFKSHLDKHILTGKHRNISKRELDLAWQEMHLRLKICQLVTDAFEAGMTDLRSFLRSR